MNKNIFPQNADRIVMVDVDVQNDFCPDGALGVTEGDRVIAPINALNEYTRANDGVVIVTGDQHPPTTPHFDAWGVHCVAGTNGAAFHKDLALSSTDVIIEKGTGQTDGFSGFEGVARNGITIEQLVQPRSPRERVAVILGGLATDYCVKATALDAKKQADRVHAARQGVIDVYVVEDAIRAVNLQPEDGANAIAEMKAAGIIITTSTDIINGTVGIEV
ncbi:isochorismatase family protein [Candidatus Saccharibacteria bacterium]|nr:isochorismatase family protein [Candidatus Saccharibacteria bacterium]